MRLITRLQIVKSPVLQRSCCSILQGSRCSFDERGTSPLCDDFRMWPCCTSVGGVTLFCRKTKAHSRALRTFSPVQNHRWRASPPQLVQPASGTVPAYLSHSEVLL